MKVVLINPSMGDYYRGTRVRPAITLSPPLNLAVLAGGLRAAGHRVAIWDLEAEPHTRVEDLGPRLRAADPDLVGVTFRTPLFPQARRIAEVAARSVPGAMRVAGGVHASTRPRETVTRAPFHVAVRGEGDRAIVALAEGRRFADIPGLTWPGGETPAAPLIEDLDSLPFPAWSLFDLDRYREPSLVAPVVPSADLESSRGCRARCIYCTKGVFGSAWRARSPERMVDEIADARDHGFRAFNLVDDSFTTITSRAIRVCEELLRRGLRMPWTLTNGIRVANVNETFFRMARRAGCHLLAFGFESGSDQQLRRIKKGATLAQARRAVAWARAHGFTILGYFMVGLPGDTEETIRETARFAASLDIDFAKFSITMPLPGTPLYEQWAPWIRDEALSDFSIHRPGRDLFDHPDFTWEELDALTREAYRIFYGRPRYVARRLLRSLARGELQRHARYALQLALPEGRRIFDRR